MTKIDACEREILGVFGRGKLTSVATKAVTCRKSSSRIGF
jgi:hypothetical protein